MTCGVFELKNIKNGMVYIGSGRNLKKAKAWLFSRLWTNKHSNKSLQADFRANAGQNFTFTILAECDPSELRATKAKFKAVPNQYRSGLKHNRPHLSKSHRANISFAMSGIKKKPMSQATKDKISQSLILRYEKIHAVQQRIWETTGNIYDTGKENLK